VPCAIAPGNHDYGPNGDASTRDTLFNEYFPYDEIARWPTFGGAMVEGRLDNTYHLFEAGGVKWIILALEWAPRDETIAWANEVMDRHADRIGILITHAYMNNNDHRYDHTDTAHAQDYNPHHYSTPGTTNDGEELWNKLVRRHDFLLVLNGHVLGDGTGYLASTNDLGRPCHQMLANYQMRDLGGEAYMRLLEFQPDGKTIQVKTYSPLYDGYLLAPDQQFRIELGERRWRPLPKPHAKSLQENGGTGVPPVRSGRALATVRPCPGGIVSAVPGGRRSATAACTPIASATLGGRGGKKWPDS
jgi:hypothetical protein